MTDPAGAEERDVLLILYVVPRDIEREKRLYDKFPGKLTIRWESNLRADGSVKTIDEYDPKLFEGVTILFTPEPIPAGESRQDFVVDLGKHHEYLPKLRFVQLSSAGSDLWLDHPKYLDKNVLFATTSGSNAPQIAEWVIASWLEAQHHFPMYAALQSQACWHSAPTESVEDSVGLKVGILGYGAIGRQVGRLCHALGMHVAAYTSTPRPTPASRRTPHAFAALPGLGDADGAIPQSWAHGSSPAAVDAFLAQGLDLLVVALPLTPATRGLIGAAQLDILAARRTFVVNVARGAIVDQMALVEALQQGKIRGAALDVTDPEPLPREHPLWTVKNCRITPHVSWHSKHQTRRCLDVLEMNLERLFAQQPLINRLSR